MLIGQYETKLTEKGRCALPKKFREEIGKKAYVAKWYEGCLVIVEEKRLKKILKGLTATSKVITKIVRDTDRFILGSAFEFVTDSQGRFVIPKTLREYANLKSEVVFLGLGNRLEVWDKSVWLGKEKQVQKDAELMVEKIAERDLSRGEG